MKALILIFLASSAQAANRGLVEGVVSSAASIYVTTAPTARVYMATSTYGGNVPNVSLYTSSNAVISNDNTDKCVIYATGTLSCLTLTGNGSSLTGGPWTRTGTNTNLTNSGDKVGIGTTNPTEKLQLAGFGTTTGRKIYSNDETTNQSFGTLANGTGIMDWGVECNAGGCITTGASANAAIIGQVGNLPLHLKTNNTVRMTIIGGGNVGIGTTNPGFALDVVGGIQSSANNEFKGSVTQIDGGGAFRWLNSASDNFATIKNPGGSGSQAMAINAGGGNVGIGTTNPTFTLDTKSYEQITNACTAVTSCTATCSAGKQVTGGGCTGVTSVLADSVAGSATTWVCTITSGNVTAQAICLAIN